LRILERFSQLYISKSVAAVPDEVPAFVWREERERDADEGQDLIKRAGPGGPEEGFQFREGLFDRIEVRTVRRQKTERRADGFDEAPDLRLFVDGEIVEHDHVAGPERRDEDLLDIGVEADRVDRPIEDDGRPEAVHPQRRNHRVGFPMAARRMVVQAGPARASAIPPQEIGGHPALIQEHILPRIVQRLRVPPVETLCGDVSAPLFVGVYGFF